MHKIETCNGAEMAGYTEERIAVVAGRETHLMVRPNTDYRDHFRAFDTDLMEMITVKPELGLTTMPV